MEHSPLSPSLGYSDGLQQFAPYRPVLIISTQQRKRDVLCGQCDGSRSHISDRGFTMCELLPWWPVIGNNNSQTAENSRETKLWRVRDTYKADFTVYTVYIPSVSHPVSNEAEDSTVRNAWIIPCRIRKRIFRNIWIFLNLFMICTQLNFTHYNCNCYLWF